MSESAVLTLIPVIDPDLKLKLRLVEITHIPTSELPYRIFKRTSGVQLKMCKERDEVNAYLATVTVEFLKLRPVRKKCARR